MKQIKVKSIDSKRGGVTVVIDAYTGTYKSVKIPTVPVGTVLSYEESTGLWKIVYAPEYEDLHKTLHQREDFYHATKDFLPYDDYEYVVHLFPESCMDFYLDNPFFLLSVYREGSDHPIISFRDLDSHVVLTTFQIRLKEMKAAITEILQNNENRGNTWMLYGDENTKETLCYEVLKMLKRHGHPLLSGSVYAYLNYFQDVFYVEEKAALPYKKVAMRTTYNREWNIYRNIKRATKAPSLFPLFDPAYKEGFSENQNNAIKNLIKKGGNISILTGGPGTGKTTILRQIVDELFVSSPDTQVVLLSPTGKATRRIKEVFGDTNLTISTIHKFLGYGRILTKEEKVFISSVQVCIVDEASMLDLEIFDRLLSMIDLQKCKLILVGDVFQLPSIGAGNVLSDLIGLGVHTCRLTENFRSGHDVIIQNSTLINNGMPILQEDESFQIIPVTAGVANVHTGYLDGNDIVISPFRKEEKNCSTTVVNRIIQDRIFAGIPQNYYSEFRLGDSVIMIHTNYEAGYFNGETGKIIQRLPSGSYMVSFGDRTLEVKETSDMALGYAITVHKSQGSEYDNVLISIPEYSPFITRRMLYTAVTRAKNKVTLLTSKEIIMRVILNNPEETRRTFLSSYESL